MRRVARSINPRPPEKVGIALWEAFRDSWNHRHGWADPLAPERHRHLKLPGSVISSPARDIEGNPIFDIREELDRLHAHIAAARALLSEGGAIGRRLDFLSQEFNRESNTLCAKSNAASLTAIGLQLKVVVDQFREQVQNIE